MRTWTWVAVHPCFLPDLTDADGSGKNTSASLLGKDGFIYIVSRDFAR